MKNFFYNSFLLLFIISFSSFSQSAFNRAHDLLNQSSYLNYKQTAYYPNPLGTLDTLTSFIQISKARNSQTDFDFLFDNQSSNLSSTIDVKLNGNFNQIVPKDSLVRFFPEDKKNEEDHYISQNRNTLYSPLTLLNKRPWLYERDTTVNGIILSNFYFIENDTVVNGNAIFTKQHIFINPISNTIERFERRNFFKGELSQTVIFQYSDYEVSNSSKELQYNLPLHFKSIPYGSSNNKPLLAVGQKAPDFLEFDLKNNRIKLSEFKGQKVLLDFSTINCGYCKLALDHFSQKTYQFPDNLSAIYINPIDSKEYLNKYIDKVKIAFSVVAQAKEVGDLYGVTAYPTFYLIDENGLIEKVMIGYNQEFLDSLKE